MFNTKKLTPFLAFALSAAKKPSLYKLQREKYYEKKLYKNMKNEISVANVALHTHSSTTNPSKPAFCQSTNRPTLEGGIIHYPLYRNWKTKSEVYKIKKNCNFKTKNLYTPPPSPVPTVAPKKKCGPWVPGGTAILDQNFGRIQKSDLEGSMVKMEV